MVWGIDSYFPYGEMGTIFIFIIWNMQVLWVFFEAFKDILRDDDASSTIFHFFQMELASSNQQRLAAFNLLGLNYSL